MADLIRDLQPPIRMRRDLGEPFDVAVWPTGVHLRSFATEHAAAVHDLLATAYTGGGGSVDAFPAWWASLATDVEFDPELLFVAWDTRLRIVGVAQCWTSAYIKDIAVRPEYRRQGLGRALVLHAFQIFKHRGALSVDLKSRSEQSIRGCSPISRPGHASDFSLTDFRKSSQ